MAYLEINCAHCHSPAGRARSSGLFLESGRDPLSTEYGACKPPVAAGGGSGKLRYAIVPGNPSKSILAYRMSSTHPSVKMPELGRTVVHGEGLTLVRDWISEFRGRECPKK